MENELTPEEIEAIRKAKPKWSMFLAKEFALEYGQAVAAAQLEKSRLAADTPPV